MYMLCGQGQVYYGQRDIRCKTNNATGPVGKITLFLPKANIIFLIVSFFFLPIFWKNFHLSAHFFGGKITQFLLPDNIVF